jgi:hypothetical protein
MVVGVVVKLTVPSPVVLEHVNPVGVWGPKHLVVTAVAVGAPVTYVTASMANGM